MSLNPLPQRLTWIAFGLPLIVLAVLFTRRAGADPLAPIQIMIILGVPLAIASIGFGAVSLLWHLSEKGHILANQSEERRRSFPLMLALAAGLLPLLTGGGIMAGWLLTHADEFAVIGIFNIAVGLVCFGFGIGCIVWHLSEYGLQDARLFDKPVPVWGVAVLLLSNFPAAFACVTYALSNMD